LPADAGRDVTKPSGGHSREGGPPRASGRRDPTNSGSGRAGGAQRRAGSGAAKRDGNDRTGNARSGAAPARRGAPDRDGPRTNPAGLPLLGPDDERPYPRATRRRDTGDSRGAGGAGGARTGRRPLAEGARRGGRKPTTGTERVVPDRSRSLPRTRDGRRGGDDPRSARREGEVTGPFKRRKAPVPADEKRPVLRLAASKRSPAKPARGPRASASAEGRTNATDRVKPRSNPARAGSASGRRTTAARTGAERQKGGSKASNGSGSTSRKQRRPTEATEELRRLAGGNATRALETLTRATDAFARGRERDALRILRPLIEAHPNAAAVRELAGLCRYRLGSYASAGDDLAAFAELSGSTEQHPVLMDCRRAQGNLRAVEELWEELRETSPSAALVTEGRIVLAGALADAGRLGEAIDLLARKSDVPGRTKEHTVRLWYALADLEERAGGVPRARALFEQVRQYDAEFADVAERLAALS
jgi:hypothetical protein